MARVLLDLDLVFCQEVVDGLVDDSLQTGVPVKGEAMQIVALRAGEAIADLRELFGRIGQIGSNYRNAASRSGGANQGGLPSSSG